MSLIGEMFAGIILIRIWIGKLMLKYIMVIRLPNSIHPLFFRIYNLSNRVIFIHQHNAWGPIHRHRGHKVSLCVLCACVVKFLFTQLLRPTLADREITRLGMMQHNRRRRLFGN